MESEDREPIFTKRLLLTILVIILIILIILLLLKRCGKGNGGVVNVNGIEVSPTTLSLEVGESRDIIPEVSPVDATNKGFTCVSSNPEVATAEKATAVIYDEVKDICRVTAISKGEAIVTLTTDDGGKTAEVPVTVDDKFPQLTGIKLNSSNYTVYVGKTKLVSVTQEPKGARMPELVYEIQDPSIATVDNNGVIKGVSVGTTTLTVRTIDGAYTASAKVTVKKNIGGGSNNDKCKSDETYYNGVCVKTNSIKPTEVSLTDNPMALKVGESKPVVFNLKPAEASQEIVCKIKSGSTYITESNCTITGVKAGTAVVTICARADEKICKDLTVNVTSSGGSSNPGGNTNPGGSSTSEPYAAYYRYLNGATSCKAYTSLEDCNSYCTSIKNNNAGMACTCQKGGCSTTSIDTIKPEIDCKVLVNSSSGVVVTVKASDSHSGLKVNPSGTYTIAQTKTYTATDNAGNQKSCTVVVTTNSTSCPGGYTSVSVVNGRCQKVEEPLLTDWEVEITYAKTCEASSAMLKQVTCTSLGYNQAMGSCGSSTCYKVTTQTRSYTCLSGGTLRNGSCYYYTDYVKTYNGVVSYE